MSDGYERVVRRGRPTPASLYTHVMRYCGDLGCRGHRMPRPPAADYSQAAPYRPPRKPPTPMDTVNRVTNYRDQAWANGRDFVALTPRQRRRVAHKRKTGAPVT